MCFFVFVQDISYLPGIGTLYLRYEFLFKCEVMFFLIVIKVAPLEIEAVLSMHPSVLNCCVIPVPDAEATNLARAYVMLKPGDEHQSITADELASYVKGEKKSFPTIRRIHRGLCISLFII